MPVQPGQLIHAYRHGFMAIPAEDEAKLLEAALYMDRNECETVIPAGRFAAGQGPHELLSGMSEAGARFGANARAKFGQSGEW